jgi:hypothetical protein
MKLLYKRPKYVSHKNRVARHAEKRRLFKLGNTRLSRKSTVGMSKRESHEWHTKRRYKAVVKAPANIAFLDDPDSVADFISQIEKALRESPSLYVEMKEVTQIDYATIASLLAVLYRSKKQGKKINGSMPKAQKAKQTLVRSGFIYTLFSRSPDIGHRYIINADNQLFTLNDRDLAVVSEIQDAVSLTVLGRTEKLPGLYTTLGELMDNTTTHASENKAQTERWWLSINHDRDAKRVEFVFIDYGVGILRSLLEKAGEHPVKNILEQAQRAFGREATDAHLKSIVTESARKIYKLPDGRGEGIYGIYRIMQRGEIGNLHIISNDAFGAVSDGKYKKLKNQFNGTLYYWDICVNNCNT